MGLRNATACLYWQCLRFPVCLGGKDNKVMFLFLGAHWFLRYLMLSGDFDAMVFHRPVL